MGGPCSTRGEKRNAYRLLVGKPEGKGRLGRPRLRWVDNIKMDLGEVGWGDVDQIGLAQDKDKWRALVNSVMNLLVPQNAEKLSSGFTTGGLSSAQLHGFSQNQILVLRLIPFINISSLANCRIIERSKERGN
jgi:hypothetical protein